MKEAKRCRECKETLPLSDFYKHKGKDDGHLNKCKACVKGRVAKHRLKNIERIREYDRRRGNRQSAEYIRKYKEKYPNKYRAKTLVNNAIRDGKLHREPCDVCGANEWVHAHHDDYSKPLNIRWLCSAHHSQWHKENGPGKNG